MVTIYYCEEYQSVEAKGYTGHILAKSVCTDDACESTVAIYLTRDKTPEN